MKSRTRNLIIGIIFLCAVGLLTTLAGCKDRGSPRPAASVTVPGATSWPPVTTQAPSDTLSEPTLTPLPSASPSPSRTWPPISSGTGESICFLTPKPPEPFSTWPEEKVVLQCVPIEGNTVHLEQPVALGEFRVGGYDTIFSLEASPNGQWLVATMGTEGPILSQFFEMTTGQAITVEPKSLSDWYYRFRGWGSDGNTAILCAGDKVIFFNLLDGHEEVESLTSPADYGVDLAPDGRRLVYAQTSQAAQGELNIQDRGTDKTLSSLTEPTTYLFNPSWSPAGDGIAYLSSPDLLQTGELWVIDEALKSPRELADLAIGYYRAEYTPRWSPDGRWLAFVVWDDPQQVADNPEKRTGNIVVADSLSGEVRALTNFEGVWTDWPSWSPDGRWIIFSKMVDETSDLWMVEVATGRLQQVTSGLNARHPAWVAHGVPVLPTPTPTSTATPSPIPSATPTYKYSPTPSPTAVLGPLTTLQVTTTEGLPVEFYHLPAADFSGVAIGTQVLFMDYFQRLILVDLANPNTGGTMIGNRSTPLIKVAPTARALVYSPIDSDSYKTRRWPLVAFHLDDGHETPLGYTYGPAFGLSSSGRVLMLEDHQLVIKNLEGTESQPLTKVETALGKEWRQLDFNSPEPPYADVSLSPDGQRIAIAYNGYLRLLTVDGDPILGIGLPDPSIRFLNWSPNGEYLTYTHSCIAFRCKSVFEVLDIAGGTSFTPQLPDSDPDEDVSDVVWSLAGDRMVFIGSNSSEAAYSLYDADRHGNNARRLGEANWWGSLVWTPDQRVLYPCTYHELRGVCRLTLP